MSVGLLHLWGGVSCCLFVYMLWVLCVCYVCMLGWAGLGLASWGISRTKICLKITVYAHQGKKKKILIPYSTQSSYYFYKQKRTRGIYINH